MTMIWQTEETSVTLGRKMNKRKGKLWARYTKDTKFASPLSLHRFFYFLLRLLCKLLIKLWLWFTHAFIVIFIVLYRNGIIKLWKEEEEMSQLIRSFVFQQFCVIIMELEVEAYNNNIIASLSLDGGNGGGGSDTDGDALRVYKSKISLISRSILLFLSFFLQQANKQASISVFTRWW